MQTQDRADYVEFVSSRLPGLRRLAYVLCGDWYHADDIIQASLTKAYLRWSSVRTSRDVDQYVRAIVVNTFLSERRLAWSPGAIARRAATGGGRPGGSQRRGPYGAAPGPGSTAEAAAGRTHPAVRR